MDLRIPHPPGGDTGHSAPNSAPVTPVRRATPAAAAVVSAPVRRHALRAKTATQTSRLGRPDVSSVVSAVRVHLVPLIAVIAGIGLMSALAWQQWGSNWWANREQSELLAELAEGSPGFTDSSGRSLSSLTAAAAAPASSDQSPALAATPAAAAGPASDPVSAAPATPKGAVARITVDKIGMDVAVVGGVSEADLRKGPGWMPGTAPIGEAGNTVISGHRTTYGGPFRKIDQLNQGDRITVTTLDGTVSVYEVRDSWVVKPRDVWVATATPGARLTLTTCHPVGSDRERLIVQAEMVEGPAAAQAIPAAQWQRSAR